MAFQVLLPVITAAVTRVLSDKKEVKLSAADKREIAAEVVEIVQTNPVVKNEVNAEAPVQSRVGWGGMTAFLSSLGIVMVQLTSNPFMQYDWAILMPALAGVWGGFYALYGRFATGLKPLFSGGE